jgi:hypothetical protein
MYNYTRVPTFWVLLVAALLATGMSGCDELNQTKDSKGPKTVVKENRVPVHRFVLTRLDGGVAFDTQAGQICRTWDWSPVAKVTKPDPQTGLIPQRSFGEFSPTCLSLYQQFPSGTNPQSESIPDDQSGN